MGMLVCARLLPIAKRESRYGLRRECRAGLPSADGGVGVLGNLLVGVLAGSVGSALDGLGDVVRALLEGVHCVDCW